MKSSNNGQSALPPGQEQLALPAGQEQLALPPGQGKRLTFQPKWTGQILHYRHEPDLPPIEHIMSKHEPKSGYNGVSKFAEGTSVKMIKSMVEEAASKGRTRFYNLGGGGILYDFGRTIGTNKYGNSATKLQVWFDRAG